MKRIDMLKGLDSIVIESFPMNPPMEENVDNSNPLFDFIFQPNERGCYVGDLSQYLSTKTNPEVRQFIEQQLLQPTSVDKGISVSDDVMNKMRSVISDDDIAKFSRNHGESQEQYALRMGSYFSEEKAKNVAKAKFEREKKRLEDLGFNFD